MKQIRVYNQVFRIEKTVYSIQGVNLPLPVSYRQLAFFVGTLVLMVVLNKFPPISWVDYFLIKFVGIPAVVAWFFTRKTLDGKAPHRFILRYVEHFFSPHHFARYREIEKPGGNCYQYEGEVAYRLTPGGDSK
ncbi:TcpE family conjugal transfer membrane protein [Lihuaxuella thermophila]|uniref:TcpE family protein n=1 Tax=Lihuaxuella thermophila TaxID=1173111 RepID=A0A1H8HGQ0_9BACL|nr:TcpE family conjugal transfer membrane protein [Lihuaxuella thermophila]SEN55280.1 TcpE family protein [Lihuaxuella thermophila]